MRQTCKGKTKTGQDCTAPALENGLCVSHDPVYKDRKQAGAANGGRAKSNANRARAAMPSELKSVSDIIFEALIKAKEGRLFQGRAQELAVLSNAYVRIYEASTAAIERSELEKEIADLKQLVSEKAA